MFRIAISSLLLLSILSPVQASPRPPQTVNLFICDTENGKQYASSMDEYPGKCSKAPDMPIDWHPLLLVKQNNNVIYLDINHVKWKGRVAEVAMFIVPVDSSQSVFKDGSSLAQFDVLTRKYFYCDSNQHQSFAIEIYRNIRSKPEFIKRFENANRPPSVVGSPTTGDGAAFALVCSRDYEKLPAYQSKELKAK